MSTINLSRWDLELKVPNAETRKAIEESRALMQSERFRFDKTGTEHN